MSAAQPQTDRRIAGLELPAALDRRFEAFVFDWDGTAVPDRKADASSMREAVERLCALGADLAVITGTHIGNVDPQLGARPAGPGRLFLCLNRGSEVFRVDENGPELIYRRQATPEEEAALDEAASEVVARLAEKGLRAEIVSQRLNRRKIDLIPEPEWADPPKARIDELLAALEKRLGSKGLDLHAAVELALEAARDAGLSDPKVTSDAKYVEIGLTDKADSSHWVFAELWRHGVGPGLVLVGGDEFGPLGRLPGSDSLLLVPEAATRDGGVRRPRAERRSRRRAPARRRPNGVRCPSRRSGPPTRAGGGPADRRRPRVDHDHCRRRSRARTHSRSAARVGGRSHRFHGVAAVEASGCRAARARRRVSTRATVRRTTLVEAPVWQQLDDLGLPTGRFERTLDLHAGVLRHLLATNVGRAEAALFSSFAEPGTVALRLEGPEALVPAEAMLPTGGSVQGTVGGVAVAGATRRLAGAARVERLGAYVTDPERVPQPEEAAAVLGSASAKGFEALLTEHRASWAGRWEAADVVVDGDADLTHAARFALFTLMASVARRGRSCRRRARAHRAGAIAATCSGTADVFVLPFLAATHPAGSPGHARVSRAASARARGPRHARANARARVSRGSRRRPATT